jgi:hypothetical protein
MLLSIAAAALSLVIVFLVVSLLCTTAQEFIAGLFSMRARTLEATLAKMLDDEERTGMLEQLYGHPLIKSLAPSGRQPSYIPKDQFAMAVHDMLTRGQALQVGNVLPVFRILMKEAGGDEAAFKKSVENWFEASMERAGGWYKRQTQRIVLTLGLLIAIGFNIDAMRIVTTIADSPPTVQQNVLDEARKIAAKANPQVNLEDVGRLQIPFGWTKDYQVAGGAVRWTSDWLVAWTVAFVGWGMTALAASLGSQFWFSILVRFVNIRSAGAKPEEAEAAKTQAG